MLELSRDRKLLKLIIDAQVRRMDDSAIVEMLTALGYGSDLSQSAVASSFEYLVRANAVLTRKLKKLKSLLGTKMLLQNENTSCDIDTIAADDLSEQIFYENYYSRNRPLKIVNAAIWFKDLSGFFIRNLLERYPNEPVEVMTGRNSDPHYELNLERHKTTTTLGEFLNHITTNTGNDSYLVPNNFVLQRTALSALFPNLSPGPNFLDRAEARNRALLWIGPSGTKTPLHHDRYNILFLQIEGTKRLYIADPLASPFLYNRIGVYSDADLEYPESQIAPIPAVVKITSFDVRAGEALFIPVFWWHQVRSMTPSVSISFGNFKYTNQFNIPDA